MNKQSLLPTAFMDRLVGFDSLLNSSFPRATNFPPYNLIKTGENTYLIEMAVAGFSKDEIEITLDDNTLVISSAGTIPENDDVSDQYPQKLHQGIAKRNFRSEFRLAPDVKVGEASLDNGMLAIRVEREQITPTAKLIPIK